MESKENHKEITEEQKKGNENPTQSKKKKEVKEKLDSSQ